ncbi:MAG TPA: hypothetical protein VJ672_13495 [Gemmatimonadaceae bacterium]|nr:hypothetical protein [Gemmatimonadaceae bacterium]
MTSIFRPHEYSSGRRSGASSACWFACLLTAATLSLGVTTPAIAQDSTAARDSAKAAMDSLSERLRRAEEAIDVLREQLATQAASSVQSATRVQVELFGRVLMNGFSNSTRVNNSDVPLFALPTGGRGALGATVRQTSLGVAVTISRVLGGDFAGDIHMDFFGGQQPSGGGRHFPLIRVRTARGIVRWQRGELLFGQEVPLIVGLNPVSVASFGTPNFVAAGNLWLWLPQLRGTLELGSPARIALQGAVLAPTSGDPANAFDTDSDPAERSRRPYLQSRLRTRWGEREREGEIGVAGHVGWLRRDDGVRVRSEALGIDAKIPLGGYVELRGEAYTGRALRGLGAGGIGQNITLTGSAVRDRGGWAQLLLRPSTRLELGSGCGVSDPDDENLPAQRQRNVACATHVITRPGGPIVAGLEYRQLRTRFPAGTRRNHHINLAVGFEF